jgi:hypothetical protein
VSSETLRKHMNRTTLTLLCTPFFSALILLQMNIAYASKLSRKNFTSTRLSQVQTVNSPAVEKSPQVPTINSNKSLSEIAIELFGCDCPGCQARASQQISTTSTPQTPQN